MNNEIRKLQPERVWHYFLEISSIPRASKKEQMIGKFLVDFGMKMNLVTFQDDAGNVLIRKPATQEKKNIKSVCLQSHMDMVCEKNSDIAHDFDKDPIQPFIDGEWITAKGTTLGADNGIGVALALAILESKDLEHGTVECLFTVDEETGLVGANNLKPNFIKSKILINLDSEDEGQLFIGCAGGIDTTATFAYTKENLTIDNGYLIKIKGLKGGHSGDDINKNRGNAVKILNALLLESTNKFDLRLAKIDIGNLRNAIPREGFALVLIPDNCKENFINYVKEYSRNIKEYFKINEPDLIITIEDAELPDGLIEMKIQQDLLNALNECPNGIIQMSKEIVGLVETSTNLAAVKTLENEIVVLTSQRSSVEKELNDIVEKIKICFNQYNARTESNNHYPGWTPNLNSEILEIVKKSYQKLFNKNPEVHAIHAGLECGLIGEKYPGIDMISYGPTMRDVHSPNERLKIDTIEPFWNLTVEILKNIPEKEV